MKQRIRTMVLAALLLLSLSVGTLAAETAVAQIGSTAYDTLDEAVSAAKDGDTIVVLADCTTEAGLNLNKNLTIQAAEGLTKNPTITFTEYGIALWQKSLTVKNCDIIMNGIGSTPYVQEWGWMTICGQAGSAINLDGVNMTMDGQGQNKHAIYADNGLRLYLKDSKLVIKNYGQDALEWNGGGFDYNVEMINSTYQSDHNRSGFTGTFNVKATNSRIDVINSSGNGSNGSNFYFTDSVVNFNNNGSHGLSANVLSSNHSTIAASGNGGNGIHCMGNMTIQNKSSVTVSENDCKISSQWTIPGAMHLAGTKSTMDAGSTVTICDNNGSGILLKNGKLTVEDECNLMIMRNTAKKLQRGGGIHVLGGEAVLPDGTDLYNNHAALAGDDIFAAEGTKIRFGSVGSDWYLDGTPDCEDKIDGWYDDTENSRWSAHEEPLYMKEFDPTAQAVEGLLALKAAHGSQGLPPVVPPVEPEAIEWQHSKSKTATNLDQNFESKVTLSLPSAEEELISDVVFVLDKSTSADLEDQALAMLQNLKVQIEDTKAQVKVGVVIFNKKANVTEFMDLETQYENIVTAMKQEIKSGTNTHAGMLAGKAMLDADTSVDASRKYLIFVSDGITYMFNEEPTAVAWSFNADGWKCWAGPDNWNSKYGSNEAPVDWNTWMSTVRAQLNTQGSAYDYPYGGTVTQTTPQTQEASKTYVNSIDKALYLTKQVYDDCVENGYHCYAMSAGTSTNHQWGPSFMDYLAGGREVSFDDIQKEIYYVLDAGSKVWDVIGAGTDNQGNAYNMDFVDDASKLSLTVGGDQMPAEKISMAPLGNFEDTILPTSIYGFGMDEEIENYRFLVRYFKNGLDGNSDECFIWDINEPVSNFAPVQLTYTVQLTNPQTDPGTYGEYDTDGSAGKGSLYTNKSAILYPEDSNGEYGKPEAFAKPTVSYEIKAPDPKPQPKPEKPEGGLLNTTDHFAYIIGYPEDYITGQPTNDQTRMPVKPQGKITRAEVATIYFRMLTDGARNHYWTQENSFSDVSLDDWFNNAISTMANAGIIEGYPDGSFRPNAFITRAEFATIAVRFFDVKYDGADQFPDIDGHWARDYINKAAFIDLVEGYPDGTFGPDRQITRAEAVTLVNRTLDRHPDKDHLLPDMLRWPDNMDTTQWYYADMQEATNSHAYDWTTDHKENWTHLREVRDWAAFEKAWSTANSTHNPGEVVKKRAS